MCWCPALLSTEILASATAVCNCAELDSEIAGCLQTVLEWHLPGLPSAQACAEIGASLMRAYDNTSTQTKLADGVKGDVLQVLGLLLEHTPEVGFSGSEADGFAAQPLHDCVLMHSLEVDSCPVRLCGKRAGRQCQAARCLMEWRSPARQRV